MHVPPPCTQREQTRQRQLSFFDTWRVLLLLLLATRLCSREHGNMLRVRVTHTQYTTYTTVSIQSVSWSGRGFIFNPAVLLVDPVTIPRGKGTAYSVVYRTFVIQLGVAVAVPMCVLNAKNNSNNNKTNISKKACSPYFPTSVSQSVIPFWKQKRERDVLVLWEN